jgi:4-hydroxyphenylpyruvate dioxygenase
MMGFRPVARHRSREVLLYRQGGHERRRQRAPGRRRAATLKVPVISRRGAARARCARGLPARAGPRRLGSAHAARGDGAEHPGHPRRGRQPHVLRRPLRRSSRSTTWTSCRFPTVDQHPPAVAGIHFFGVVQYIGNGRSPDWIEFYRGAVRLRDPRRAALRHPAQGRILRARPDPANALFMLQLIEPEAGARRRARAPAAHRPGRARRAGRGAGAARARHGVRRDRGVHTERPRRHHARPTWAA